MNLFRLLLPQFVKNYYHGIQSVAATVKYGFPARRLHVIAVTGTDGKTTTSTLIYHLLHQSGFKVALISTVAARIGDKEIDTGLHVTSPDPWQLQKLLSRISSAGYQYIVLEVTSHGIDQHRLLGIKPDIAVLTNITHEHLDYHHTFEHYQNTKLQLLKRSRLSFVNKQDKRYQKYSQILKSSTQFMPYSLDLLPNTIQLAIRSRFTQAYNQQNAAAASIVAITLNISDAQIASTLHSFAGIPGRLESIPNKFGINLYVDFAHTPNALKNVLTHLKTQTQGHLIAVYGSAGLRDKTKRPLMGQVGSELADEVILTAEDPRTESAQEIIFQMLDGVTRNHGHIHSIPDRQDAINFAIKLAQSSDTVAVLGKGHEKSMCFGTTEYPWSDKQALHKALKLKAKL